MPSEPGGGRLANMDPIHTTLERWHAHTKGKLEGGLDALLHDDVVFYSPVVFTPQVGKQITMMYLGAAGATMGGEPEPDAAGADGEKKGGFKYTTEVASGHTAVLEFETTMGGKYVNGIDMITCDDDAMITEFKVMIRPLQAVNMVHQQMMSQLESMKP